MQAIHNNIREIFLMKQLFQRAKLQDKRKQFTTNWEGTLTGSVLFQRAKLQDKRKQFTTYFVYMGFDCMLFQRAKLQDKRKQFTTPQVPQRGEAPLFQRAKVQDKCKQFTFTQKNPHKSFNLWGVGEAKAIAYYPSPEGSLSCLCRLRH